MQRILNISHPIGSLSAVASKGPFFSSCISMCRVTCLQVNSTSYGGRFLHEPTSIQSLARHPTALGKDNECSWRAAAKHDLEDIEHLVSIYPNEIESFASRLDSEACYPYSCISS